MLLTSRYLKHMSQNFIYRSSFFATSLLLIFFTALLLPTRAAAATFQLDSAFGTNGKISTTPLNSSTSESLNMVMQDNNGKYVVVGKVTNSNDQDTLIARYNSDGTLDTTFNSTGYVITEFNASYTRETFTRVILDSNNKYVVVGQSGTGVNTKMIMARFNQSGSLDTTFNSTGYTELDISSSGSGESGRAIKELTTGKYLVLGVTENNVSSASFVAVARLSSAGVLDTTYNSGTSYRIFDFSDASPRINSPSDLYVNSSDEPYFSGYAKSSGADKMLVAKLTSAGALDTTFNTTGYRLYSDSSNTSGASLAQNIIADSSGRLLVYGYTRSANNNRNYTILRLSTAGAFDTTFGGGDGHVEFLVSTVSVTYGYPGGIVTTSDGSIFASGYIENSSGGEDLSVLKFTSSGTLDTSFATNGLYTTNFFGSTAYHDGFSSIVDSSDRLLVTGEAYTDTDTSPILMRFTGLVDAAGNNSNTSDSGSGTSSTSSSTSPPPQPPTCQDEAPNQPPQLFQITRKKRSTSARLAFVPAGPRVSGYIVEYARKNKAYEHATQFDWSDRSGVVLFTVDALDKNVDYTFRVIPRNGCAYGPASNAKTTSTVKK